MKTRCPLLGVENYVPGGFIVKHPVIAAPQVLSDDQTIVDPHPGLTSDDSIARANVFLDELTVCVPPNADMSYDQGGHAMLGSYIAPMKQESMGAPDLQQTVSPFGALPIRERPKSDLVINPDRAAMIAATPIAELPNEKVRFFEGVGPQRSGMNSIPLGTRQPRSPSQPFTNASSAMGSNETYTAMSEPTGPTPASKAYRRNRAPRANSMSLRSGAVIDRSRFQNFALERNPAAARERSNDMIRLSNRYAIWENLKQQIATAVRDSAVEHPKRGKGWGKKKVKKALDTLEGVILGQKGSN